MGRSRDELFSLLAFLTLVVSYVMAWHHVLNSNHFIHRSVAIKVPCLQFQRIYCTGTTLELNKTTPRGLA